MAAPPPEPPRSVTNLSTQSSLDSHESTQKRRSDCFCTNIGIMQLFHEMKQEFPTIPDHVVNQCVIDNCHDRDNCIQILKQELPSYPSQAYPSHAFRNNHNSVGSKSGRAATRQPVPVSKVNCDTKDVQMQPEATDSISRNHTHTHNMQLQTDISGSSKTCPPLLRPTTLNFHEPRKPDFCLDTDQSRPDDRVAQGTTIPPIGKQSTHVQASDLEFESKCVHSPVGYSDSGESGISVNISLSPTSSRGPGVPIRRTSAITIQPELPYARELVSQSPRSFTSLNLTLRKPSATPQSPIDITAGQGLTYSSSSFDARLGYQKNFHIVVNDQGGVFSASRIRPVSCYNSPTQHPEKEFLGVNQKQQLRTASSEQDFSRNYNASEASTALSTHIQEGCTEVIRRQRMRKDQLAKVLEQNKRRLKEVQCEIDVLTKPIIPGESERLDCVIERLRGCCQEILNKIEDSKRSSGLGNSANAENAYPGQEGEGGPGHRPPLPHLSQLQGDTRSAAGQPSTMDDSYMINNADGDPPWTCSMCTFQNHPLLNKCECCENIRILPGTIRIVPSDHMDPRLLPRFPNSLAGINNNIDSNQINFYNTETFQPVMNALPPANSNFVVPGNE